MKYAALLAALCLGTGCVYYNGVYNAKRLTRAAERAEREGRTIEAKDYWSQVVVKADSVVARHPASNYVPQVELLRGRALGRLDQCAEAIPSLQEAIPLAADPASDAVESGTFELARCQAVLGNVEGAADAYGRLLSSRDIPRRNEARYQYAHALRLAGRYDAALESLDGLADPRAPAERMVALGGTGKLTEALALADSLMARGDTIAPWDSLLSAAGRRDPAAVSRLVDRLVALPQASAEMKSRWLLEDGRRLLLSDTARADGRLAEAATLGASTAPAGRARLLRTELVLSRARTSADFGPVVDSLGVLRDAEGARLEATTLYDAAVRIRAAADTGATRRPQGDLALFLAAETARDDLGDRALARFLFGRVVDEWPRSPYAPKAMLAVHRLEPGSADDFEATLAQRYPGSPYLAALRGQNVPELRVLEDSLSGFAAGQRGAPGNATLGVPVAPGSAGQQAPGVRRPVEPQ